MSIVASKACGFCLTSIVYLEKSLCIPYLITTRSKYNNDNFDIISAG
jgi:hypothetical protein